MSTTEWCWCRTQPDASLWCSGLISNLRSVVSWRLISRTYSADCTEQSSTHSEHFSNTSDIFFRQVEFSWTSQGDFLKSLMYLTFWITRLLPVPKMRDKRSVNKGSPHNIAIETSREGCPAVGESPASSPGLWSQLPPLRASLTSTHPPTHPTINTFWVSSMRNYGFRLQSEPPYEDNFNFVTISQNQPTIAWNVYRGFQDFCLNGIWKNLSMHLTSVDWTVVTVCSLVFTLASCPTRTWI